MGDIESEHRHFYNFNTGGPQGLDPDMLLGPPPKFQSYEERKANEAEAEAWLIRIREYLRSRD